MKNILNLKKNPANIVFVEKVLPRKRTWYFEVFSLFVVIAISSGIIFTISHADNVTTTSNNTPIGIYGIVTSISNNSLSLDDSHGSKHKGVDLFNVDLSNISQIETSSDKPVSLLLSDINVGDKIIAKGTISGSNLYAQTIISFSATSSKGVINVATSTATSTESIARTTATSSATTATSTSDLIASTTATTTNSNSTSSASSTDSVSTTTATSTATSTEEAATTLTSTSTSTTTPEVSTSTATSTDVVSSTTATTTTSEDSSSTSTDTDVTSTTTPPLSYLIDLSNQTASAFDAVKYIFGQMLHNINFFKLFNK